MLTEAARQAEPRTIVAIATPLMVAYVAEMGMMITDMIIVGRLGSRELAAVGLTADWFYVLLLIGMGVVSIVGVLAAQGFGAGDRRIVQDAVEQGNIAATIMSIPVMLSIWYLGPALSLARQDPEVVRLITDYSHPLTLGVLPALWFTVYRNYVTALAKASSIMIITAGALLLNLALNYTLVYGKFGFPALGVVGAGIGTTIVTWLMFAALASHVLLSTQFRDFRPKLLPDRINTAVLKEIFVLGLPITAAQMLNGAMFTVAAVLAGILSADILAGQQIAYTVIYLALSAGVALGDAVRVRVAYGIGLRSVAAARHSARISLSIAVVVSVVAAILLWGFPEAIVSIFLDTSDAENAEVLRIAVGMAVYAGIFVLLDGVLIVLGNSIRGLRDTRSPLIISAIGYWVVGLGAGTLFCFPLGYGVDGLWWGLSLGPLVAIVLMALRLRTRFDDAEKSLAALPPRAAATAEPT